MLQNIFNTLANGAAQSGNQQQGGGDVLSSVLGSLMGGQTSTPATSTPQQSAGGGLEDLVGSLMGGQTTPAATPAPQQPAGGELGGLLGSLLGGGQTSPAAPQVTSSNPLMNLVGSGQNPMLNMLIQPLVDQIAQKLGIPDALAMAAVTFAIHYMITQHGTKLANGEDMGAVLEKHVDTNHLNTNGISQNFAKQAGVDQKTAANTLSEVFKLLGTSAPTQ